MLKMAMEKFNWSTRWILAIQVTLCLLAVVAEGVEDAEDAYASGKNLISEFFLPINLANLVEAPIPREKRDLEGSGDDENSSFSELVESVPNGKEFTNATESTFEKLIESGGTEKNRDKAADFEGSGEVEDERDGHESSAIIIGESENLTTERTEATDEVDTTTTAQEESSTEAIEGSGKVIEEKTVEVETTTEAMEETTTAATEVLPIKIDDSSRVEPDEAIINQTTELSDERTSTEEGADVVTEIDTETVKPETTIGIVRFINMISTTPSMENGDNETIDGISHEFDSRALESATDTDEETTTSTTAHVTATFPAVLESRDNDSGSETSGKSTEAQVEEIPVTIVPTDDSPVAATESLPPRSEETLTPTEVSLTETTSGPAEETPAIEPVFTETKLIHKTLEASPGNILHKKNMTLGVDPLIIVTNTGMMESEETGQMTSGETRRLGAYIVIAVIILSFATLVGYIMFRKRSMRKRLNFEKAQECDDTEKALLSLNDYKDNSEPEDSNLKNNEKSPMVIKSNAKINRFEKNTNFSSPKNLNTMANEKNLEKDNVLKSTTENLTQAIIEDSPKDAGEEQEEEEKNSPDMEKLIVKTRIDQDSIPKKPIIVNRSSTGYVAVPQDNV